MTWQETWRVDSHLAELEDGGRGDGTRRGSVGLAKFPAGWYPACSLHGAMNRVSRDKPAVWRCLAEGCNVGTRIAFENGLIG